MDQVYTASKVVDHLWAISEGGVRCFLCEGARAAMLVDTGYGGGNLKAFVQTLTDRPVFVVNTHTDGDHVGCNALFGSARLHPAEYGYYAAKKPGDNTQLSPLWEGDVIDLGTMKFEIILIPGHTPGSIALLDRENRLLIGGDSIQRGAIFMFGPGRNLPAYICSMEKLAALSSAFDRVLPSHGPMEVGADILPRLIECAKLILAGKLAGVKPERPLPCLLYSHNGANFLYAEGAQA